MCLLFSSYRIKIKKLSPFKVNVGKLLKILNNSLVNLLGEVVKKNLLLEKWSHLIGKAVFIFKSWKKIGCLNLKLILWF